MDAGLTTTDDGWSERDAGRMGLWMFILSEILLFGGFLCAYAGTRLGNPDCALGTVVWPEAGHLPGLAMAALNTLILLTSSYTMVRAIGRAERGDREGFRRNLVATMALGGAFLVVKACEYALKISHGYYPGSEFAKANPGISIFLSYYYAMTILHGLHIVAGLVWNGVVLRAGRQAAMETVARKAEFAGLYWHFVDVVWVFLFPLFYLI
ncbi:MAG: cytochrome c oxidase subunit 3 [Elusimicrobia bacterium]|nr:cytochrome c oxidase subunit 3 [Elusimicrobiota bacterium]